LTWGSWTPTVQLITNRNVGITEEESKTPRSERTDNMKVIVGENITGAFIRVIHYSWTGGGPLQYYTVCIDLYYALLCTRSHYDFYFYSVRFRYCFTNYDINSIITDTSETISDVYIIRQFSEIFIVEPS